MPKALLKTMPLKIGPFHCSNVLLIELSRYSPTVVSAINYIVISINGEPELLNLHLRHHRRLLRQQGLLRRQPQQVPVQWYPR